MFHRSSFTPLFASLPLLLLPLLLLPACGDEPSSSTIDGITFDPCQPLMVVPDATATDAQRAGVADGIALWNAAAATRLSMGGGATDAQPAATAIPTVPIVFQAAAGAFYGLYEPKIGQIFINVALGGHQLAVTVAHEIGHTFGLVHIPASQRPSLMNPGNLVNEPTAADVATLDAHWAETCSQSDSGP